MKMLLPILIIVSFFVLHFAGKSGDSTTAIAGLALLLLGMSGSLITRFFQKGSK
ncbi:hypothetical protein TAMA11512_01940 [Selenomonas sp. TAMA-11512]|uniref:hypothetical protein n=1 Tax=Selenomonas sp. TAMA-11512 TaxID=3095337 RepID=UPI0030929A97|nr:hypothetical protein TAMA11512_01940 [Selenomonas sp. TAMA-11512]